MTVGMLETSAHERVLHKIRIDEGNQIAQNACLVIKPPRPQILGCAVPQTIAASDATRVAREYQRSGCHAKIGESRSWMMNLSV